MEIEDGVEAQDGLEGLLVGLGLTRFRQIGDGHTLKRHAFRHEFRTGLHPNILVVVTAGEIGSIIAIHRSDAQEEHVRTVARMRTDGFGRIGNGDEEGVLRNQHVIILRRFRAAVGGIVDRPMKNFLLRNQDRIHLEERRHDGQMERVDRVATCLYRAVDGRATPVSRDLHV